MSNDTLTHFNTSYQADDLVKLQKDRYTQLENLLKNFKKASAARRTSSYFALQLQRLSKLHAEFNAAHAQLVCTAGEEEADYFKQDVALKFEELHTEVYCDIQDAYETKFPQNVEQAPTTTATTQVQNETRQAPSVQLPDMPTPQFSGRLSDWPEFHDSFSRLIHQNLSLNIIQKFFCLKKGLPDGSDVDIKQMPLSEANYKIAWDTLVKRYDNPRVLFMNQMNNLYALPVLAKERSDDIKLLLNTTVVCMNEMRRLNIPIDDSDHWIAHFLTTRLPRETHQAWEYHWGSKTEVPRFSDLERFLNNRLVTMDAIENRTVTHSLASSSKSNEQVKPHAQADMKSMKRNSNRNERKTYHATAKQSTSQDQCCVCNGTHVIRKCQTFLSKDCFERKKEVDRHKLCLNCLSRSHFVSQCPSPTNCFHCGQRHHTLLHFPSNEISTTSNSNAPQSAARANSTAASAASTNNHGIATHTTNIVMETAHRKPARVLLGTALIPVVNPKTGRKLILRALIDDCSEGTLITRQAARALGLERIPMITDVTGVGDRNESVSTEYVSFTLQSNLDRNYQTFVEMAFVMDVVTSKLPSRNVEPQEWPHIHGLALADPTYFESRQIDLLIGIEMAASILLPDMRIGHPDHPIAQNSHFGWILKGKTEPTHATKTHSITIRCHQTTVSPQLDAIVQQFFDTEGVPEDKTLSEEEKWFVDFFNATCTRQANGKYLVRLPLKTIVDPNQTLGRSRQISLNRFHQLERRLQRTDGLMERYSTGIQEYFELNQIVSASTSEEEHCSLTSTNKSHVTACVLAHHAVIKEDSLTTQLRIVFDASAKTSNGKSLNDLLVPGPPMQNELPSVILNWRMHRFVFTADIKKMYRCIDMHSDDTSYQRIFWRNDQGEIQEFCLTTVTFGTASAPCTAIMIIHRIADDEKVNYPLAENVLKRDMYVDDVQTGSDTIEQAIQIRDQVIGALQSAGMELRKWSSNSPALLESIPIEHQCSSTLLEISSNETVKTLGMCWKPNEDVFKFKIKFELSTIVTKRSVLSTAARLFDPLGFITPVIVVAKIILKSIWNLRRDSNEESQVSFGWDDAIPEPLRSKWLQFLEDLPSIENIAIPRWYNYRPTSLESVQLHAFCDGSSSAYGTSIYIRLQYSDEHIHTQLVMAKSKVTPTKPLTIPRVELCGAELATRLASWVKRNLRTSTDNIPIYFWSDATIVLYWIHGDITRWKTYVANRVSKILSISSSAYWSHVDTKENPADCATRGLSPIQLANFDLWWKGPTWLAQHQSNWPTFNAKGIEFDDSTSEAKSNKVHVHLAISGESIIFHYSSYTKLLRVTAWILRFQHNIRKTNQQIRRYGSLTTAELLESMFTLVRLVQAEAFGKELHLIRESEPLPNKSKIRGLAPFIDKNGIVRVWGRVQRSQLPYSRKHPIILPSKHHFTALLIDYSHKITLHGGVKTTLNHLRHTFWIVNSNQVIGSQLRKCVRCFRQKPEVSTQMMGNLPYHRVNPPIRAFAATGVDYTGAIELKSSRYRGNTTYKGYIAVFICLATKAVHLEAVTGLSTEHFLMALHRFTGRRGLPKDMFSDNGTNFVGADNVINSNQALEADVVPKLAEKGIQWHFTPPYSPNFGGLWEANVKSTKYHLKRIVDGTRLTYEELSTMLVRIESCLNSRPLCPLTADPDDLDVLTPGHFLIGDALLAPPPENATTNIKLSANYIAIQQMIQSFWSKWSSDWLSHLQVRPKWHKLQPNLEINDLVLIKDDRLPPNDWLLGRIVQLHPGSDELVRVATVRTKIGLCKRSISKLCRLPIGSQAAENQQ